MWTFGDTGSEGFAPTNLVDDQGLPNASLHPIRRSRGFSLLELVVVLAVSLVMAAMAVPVIQSSVAGFRLRGAVASVTGAIQSTRYRAIFDGCPYQIALSKASNTYQISNTVTGAACAAAFTNVGAPIPFAPSSGVALSQDVTLQFSPGGSIQVIAGSLSFNMTGVGTTIQKSIQVTKYGSVTVQ
jgi:prepilin-type N-terminal cleavage/methylation domain-containing protein